MPTLELVNDDDAGNQQEGKLKHAPTNNTDNDNDEINLLDTIEGEGANVIDEEAVKTTSPIVLNNDSTVSIADGQVGEGVGGGGKPCCG
jgi:hypothetical protein